MATHSSQDLALLRKAEDALDPTFSAVFESWQAGQAALDSDPIDDAEDHFRSMITAPKAQRCPASDVLGLCGMARVNFARGLRDPAEEMIARAEKSATSCRSLVWGWVHATKAQLARNGGDPERALEAWRDAVDAFRDGEAWSWTTEAVDGLIPASIAAGEPAKAVSALQLVPDAEGTDLGTRLLIGRAEVAEALGDVQRALRLTASLSDTPDSTATNERLAALRIRCAQITGTTPPPTELPNHETASVTGIRLLLNAAAANMDTPPLMALQTRAEQINHPELAAMAAGLAARDDARAGNRDSAIFHLTNAERMAQMSNHAGCQLRTARQRAQIELNLGLGTPVRIRSLLQVHLEMARVSGDTLAETHARLLLAQCVPVMPDEAAATHAAAARTMASQRGYQPLATMAGALSAIFDPEFEIPQPDSSNPVIVAMTHMAHLARCKEVTTAVDHLRHTHDALENLGHSPSKALIRVMRRVMQMAGLQLIAEGTGTNLVIHETSGQFWLDGQPLVKLKPSSIPFRLLRAIAVEGSRIDKATLFERAWEQSYRPPSSDNTLYVNLHRLRGKVSEQISIDPTEDGGYAIRGRPNVFQWFDEPPVEPLNPFPTVSPAADPPENQETNTNLPPPADTFIGRRKEIAKLFQRYGTGSRMVTLTGPSGVGKSRLASQVGWDLAVRGAHASGVWLANITQASTHEAFLEEIARVLSVPLMSGKQMTPAEQLSTEITARGDILLILDGVNELSDQVGETIEQWLWSAPRLRILVTSNSCIQCDSERPVALEPLPEPDAVVLFQERAKLVRPGFQVMDANRPSVVGTVHKLDRLPLAIELAAARMDLLDPEALHAQLTERFHTLTTTQAVTEKAVEWTLGLLNQWERQTLAQCCVFRGGFNTNDAEAIVRLNDPDAPWVGDVIDALRRRSVLQSHDGTSGSSPRFTILQSIASHVQQLVEDQEDLESLHAEHMLSQGEARVAGLRGPGGPACLLQLIDNLDNILAVVERFRGKNLTLAARATLVATEVLRRTGPFDKLHTLLDQTAQIHTALDPVLGLRVLLAQAIHAVHVEPDLARSALELAATRAQNVTDERWLGQLAYTHGWVWMHQPGRLSDAAVAFEQAKALYESAGFTAGIALTLQRLAVTHHWQGNSQRGATLLEEAVTLHESIGDVLNLAPALGNLGSCERALGLNSATRRLQRALSLAQDNRDIALVGTIHTNLANAYHGRWRIDAARYHYEQAIEHLRRAGRHRQSSIAIFNLGNLCADQGDGMAARSHLHRARIQLNNTGEVGVESRVLLHLAKAHLDAGDTDKAQTLSVEAGEAIKQHGKGSNAHGTLRQLQGSIALDTGDTAAARKEWSALPKAKEEPVLLAQLAWIDHQEGQLEAARIGYEHCLNLLRGHAFERMVGRVYLRIACLHAQQGNEEAAAEAMSEAHSQFEATQDLVGMRNLEVLERCGMPRATDVACAAPSMRPGGLEQRLLLRTFRSHE